MLDWLAAELSFIAENFWNTYTIGLLLGTGAILTIATRFVQVRRLTDGFSLVMQGAMRKDDTHSTQGDITPFQALTTALSATVGNGNIAGVATAIATGGPGAIFWMWITAIVGMATKYSEALLGVQFRQIQKDGSMSAGPMYYIREGLRNHRYFAFAAVPLATIFAICGSWTALFGTGNMIQSNSIALAFNSQFQIPFWVTASVLSVMVGMVIVGGIKRIGMVTERLIPFMIVVYILSALFVLITHIELIPGALAWIVQSAFTPHAALGGFTGHAVKEAISMGVRRGLLSNEAGMGSAPIAYGAAKTDKPVNQGLIATMEVFIDTILVCTMTALVILVTGAYTLPNAEQTGTLTSTALTAAAFNEAIPVVGGVVVALSSFLFGFSTLIGWYYYGEQCMAFLLGLKIIKPYRLFFVILCFMGAMLQKEHLSIVWNMGDISNGLMAFPNLVGLLGLSGVIAALTRKAEKEDINNTL